MLVSKTILHVGALNIGDRELFDQLNVAGSPAMGSSFKNWNHALAIFW
jgi:hypothetical protein